MRDLLLEIRAQIVQMLLGSSDEEITLRAIAGGMPECLLEIAKEGNRKKRHPDIHGCRKLRPYAAHAFPRGALALVAFALQYDDLAAARFGELIGDTRPDDSGADDDYVCCRIQAKLLKKAPKEYAAPAEETRSASPERRAASRTRRAPSRPEFRCRTPGGSRAAFRRRV